MSSLFGTLGALLLLGVIGYLIYRYCIRRTPKEQPPPAVYPANPAMGEQHYAGVAPYPTGPAMFPQGPGTDQPPYPTTNVAPQPGAGWAAPGGGWDGHNSPPPPYPGP